MSANDLRVRSAHERPQTVASAMIIGAASMLILGVAPILYGGLAEAGRLSQAGVGRVATLETLGLALGATCGPFLMNAGHMRAKTVGASLLLALVNVAIYWAGRSDVILLERAASGLLEGLMLGSVNVVLTHNHRPERMNGLMLGVSTAPQIVAAYLLPIMLIPRFGLNIGFGLIAVGGLLAAAAAPALVDRVGVHREAHGVKVGWTPALVVFVVAAFCQTAAIGAAWNYVERLAAQQHLGPQTVGAAIAGSLGCQLGGALLSAWLSWRLPARAFLIGGSFLQALVVIGLTLALAPAGFVALSCVFGLFWLALLPFQITELIALDPSRKLAILMTPLALLGMSVGPFEAAMFVRDANVAGAFWAAGGLLLATCLLYVLSARLRRSGAESRAERSRPRRATP